MRRPYLIKFVFAIALPLIIATFGVASMTATLLERMSNGANGEDHERTRRTVRSALDATAAAVGNTAIDNGYWDDAARRLYGTVNIKWLSETFASSTSDGTNYDAVLVVDPAKPTALGGFRRGEAFTPLVDIYFSGHFGELVGDFSQAVAFQNPRSAIINTADGLAFVGAAVVAPTSEGVAVAGSTPRYIVFVRYLTPDLLTAMGEQYLVPDLALAGSSTSGSEVIQDIAHDPVASLTWRDRRPGDEAFRQAAITAAVSLGFLALVMLGVATWCWVLLRDSARAEEQARHEALHDMLTGLPNRIALANELNALLGARENEIAVAFVDLDGFKEVNDNYDHNVGDRLIQTVSRGLAILVDGRAGAYRLGGDEFILVFSDRDAHGSAQSFAMNLIQFLAKPFDFEGRLASVGASIGIATSNGEMMDAAELMRRADIAMYRAKHEGKSRHCTYLPEFDAERVEDIAIAERLSAVLGAEGLDVVYQPIFDTRTRDMVGVEALCRWPEGHGGKVDTERFVRVAENSGLIDALGVSVLARACSEASRWSGIRLAVNISVAQLRNPNFAESALRIIDESGLSRDRIELEVTETRLVEDARRANAVFRLLRREGVQIALDDFGAGYSSIGYLRQFEFDRIKIDRSLVSRVLDGSTDHNLVQGTMLLASGLSASVTAEGVESEQQISALRAIGCTEMQGFYLSRPVSADEIDILLARHDRIVA